MINIRHYSYIVDYLNEQDQLLVNTWGGGNETNMKIGGEGV